jgi:tetratricopeptide (TPR) repeat protein
MPVSKKPRKKSKPSSSSTASPGQATPDRRAIEGVMSTALKSVTLKSKGKNAVSAAQDIMYEAWDATTKRKRIALAHKALEISPLCADAHVLLAEDEAKSMEEALELFRKGVEAGEKALGHRGFKEFAGHFWGFLETRPYMRARAGLAATLGALGDVDGAIAHYTEMLELNPNDNQGIRYALASCLMRNANIEALKRLFKQFDEDWSALWLYSRALIAFRETGDGAAANDFAESALAANGHVPAVLTGEKKVKPRDDGYITMGGEDEAGHYVAEWGFDWVTTPGAIEWLKKMATNETAGRKRGSTRH